MFNALLTMGYHSHFPSFRHAIEFGLEKSTFDGHYPDGKRLTETVVFQVKKAPLPKAEGLHMFHSQIAFYRTRIIFLLAAYAPLSSL